MAWTYHADPIMLPETTRIGGSRMDPQPVLVPSRQDSSAAGPLFDVYAMHQSGDRVPPGTNKVPECGVAAERSRLRANIEGPMCRGCDDGCYWCSAVVRESIRERCCPHCSGTGLKR